MPSKRITNEQIYEAILKRDETLCPASKEQYERHCEFIDYELAHREKREKILNDTAELLSSAMHELSLLKDRVLVIETSATATWKTIVGTSVIVGVLSSLVTLIGSILVFGSKVKGGM